MQIARGKKLIKSQRRIENTSSFSILHYIWSLKTIKENYFLNHLLLSFIGPHGALLDGVHGRAFGAVEGFGEVWL